MQAVKVFLLFVATFGGGCQGLENLAFIDRILDFTPGQIEVLSQFVAVEFMSAFVNRLKAKYGVASDHGPGTKGFPILPNLPKDVCYNATEFGFGFENISGIGFRYNQKMLTDRHIFGYENTTDGLDIFINGSDPNIPLTVGWTMTRPKIRIEGDTIIEFELGFGGSTSDNLTLVSQATNASFEIEDGYLQFSATAGVFPLNETISFDNLELTFGSKNVSWIADWLIQLTGAPDIQGRVDIGPLVKSLHEGTWAIIGPSLISLIKCGINYVVEDCTVLDILDQNTPLDCFKYTGFLFACLGIPTSEYENRFKNSWTGDWNSLAQECPARQEPTTTEEATTSTRATTTPESDGNGGMVALRVPTPFFFVTTVLMFFATHF